MAALGVAFHAIMPLYTFGAGHGSRSWVVPPMAAVIAIIFWAGQSRADQLPVGETLFFHRRIGWQGIHNILHSGASSCARIRANFPWVPVP